MRKIGAPSVLLCLPKWQGRNHGFFLGIAALVASLREAGIDVAVFDEDVAEYAAEKEHCCSPDLLQKSIKEYAPTLVGIHMNTPNYANSLSLACRIRQITDAPIVAGGPHATVAGKVMLLLHPEIDFVLKGESDITLPILAEQLHLGKQPSNIPNIILRKGGDIIEQPATPPIQLSCLPLPARDALIHPPFPTLTKWSSIRYQENFYSTIRSFDGRKATNAYATRGCVRVCPFCFPGKFWLDPTRNIPCRRVRSLQNLIEEITMLRETGYGAIYFDEAAFPFDQNSWVLDFADRMRNLDMYWGGAALLSQVRKAPLYHLAKCGLRYLYFGLESPVIKLQQEIDKKISIQEVQDLLDTCSDIGIQCDVSLFFGIPGETEQTIQETIEWIDTNLTYGNAFFSIAAIWPGTKWAESAGLTPEHWEPDYDKNNAPGNVVWYGHELTAIGKFFSNSLGTYHPSFMTPKRALKIKEVIINSGFRARFAKYARRTIIA